MLVSTVLLPSHFHVRGDMWNRPFFPFDKREAIDNFVLCMSFVVPLNGIMIALCTGWLTRQVYKFRAIYVVPDLLLHLPRLCLPAAGAANRTGVMSFFVRQFEKNGCLGIYNHWVSRYDLQWNSLNEELSGRWLGYWFIDVKLIKWRSSTVFGPHTGELWVRTLVKWFRDGKHKCRAVIQDWLESRGNKI